MHHDRKKFDIFFIIMPKIFHHCNENFSRGIRKFWSRGANFSRHDPEIMARISRTMARFFRKFWPLSGNSPANSGILEDSEFWRFPGNSGRLNPGISGQISWFPGFRDPGNLAKSGNSEPNPGFSRFPDLTEFGVSESPRFGLRIHFFGPLPGSGNPGNRPKVPFWRALLEAKKGPPKGPFLDPPKKVCVGATSLFGPEIITRNRRSRRASTVNQPLIRVAGAKKCLSEALFRARKCPKKGTFWPPEIGILAPRIQDPARN